MESLRQSIKQLIEKTLNMEQDQEKIIQGPRLQKMMEDATDPCNQSQPYPEEDYLENSQNEKTCNQNNEETLQTSEDLEKNQDFYPTEKSIIKRHRVKYTATRIKYYPTRVKSRHFLSNISYTGISKGDFYNENFILDVYICLSKTWIRSLYNEKHLIN